MPPAALNQPPMAVPEVDAMRRAGRARVLRRHIENARRDAAMTAATIKE